MISWITRVINIIANAGGWVGSVACITMMALVVANVVLRFTWQSIPGTLDVTETLMVVITVMMLAYTQAKRGHINVEFVTNYLSARTQQALRLFTLLLALGFTVFLTWQSWNLGLVAWRLKDASTTAPYVPYYPAKLILAVGVSLLCLQLLFDLGQEIRHMRVQKAK